MNPGWAEGDGGELVLTPFLSRRVRVRPKHDRLAVFYSDRVCHSVEPARAERFCLTVWLDGVAGSVNTSEDTQLSLPASVLTDPDAVAETLRLSAAQRSLSRAVYAEAYRESLTRCMAGAAGCDEMLAATTPPWRRLAGTAARGARRKRCASARRSPRWGGYGGVGVGNGRERARNALTRFVRAARRRARARVARVPQTQYAYPGRGGGRSGGFGVVNGARRVHRARVNGPRREETRPATAC